MTQSSTSLLRALRVLPLLILITGCGMSAINNDKAQNNLHEAARQALLNNTTQARVWADRAIQIDPNNMTTYVGPMKSSDDDDSLSIAAIFLDTGDDRTLIDYMHQAVAKTTTDYRPLQTLVDAEGRIGDLTNQKKDATALAAMLEKKLITPGATDFTTLNNVLAQAYCDAGDDAKGRAKYLSTIAAYPKELSAYNGLAYHYAVIDSKPDLADALVKANTALKLAQSLDLSQELIDQNVSAIQDTIGWVQYRQGNYKDALSNVQSAINATPRQSEERYHLGMIYLALGRKDDAAIEFNHAILINKDYADPLNELAKLKGPAATSLTATSPPTST